MGFAGFVVAPALARIASPGTSRIVAEETTVAITELREIEIRATLALTLGALFGVGETLACTGSVAARVGFAIGASRTSWVCDDAFGWVALVEAS